jgi:hypothetical protein
MVTVVGAIVDRIVTLIGAILAVLVIVFHLASLLTFYVPLLLAVAVLRIGIGAEHIGVGALTGP